MAALRGYRRLPFAGENIPGAYLEAVLATVRDARVLRTYDFVDVIDDRQRVGWQVKSTMLATPVTWKRAKIPNAERFIAASRSGEADGVQKLGDAIIEFCNAHVRESLRRYDLTAIGYARVCVTKAEIVYFERELVTRDADCLFEPSHFEWRWSNPKTVVQKEQLPALHGFLRSTGEKWFAWHGLGENQLHFGGEGRWWPTAESGTRISSPRDDTVKIPFEEFVQWVTVQERVIAARSGVHQ